MADYIYLLEKRLSAGQRDALRTVTDLARSKGLTVFLVGGAVRDLTSGSPVRDLDLAVQGNALTLEAELAGAGAVITGRHAAGQALYVSFPGSVRAEVGSTLSIQYPKPGQPVASPASILDDLRRRDFTANAMALSLNPGSYGLLMDPLNGVADIENRQLRLVSNYGFIEDPIRMVRAARLMARLGWTLDEKTEARYQTGREEGYISALSDFQRGYELEEIVHEEDPVRVLRRLEADGWMEHLAPFWTSAKANVAELDRMTVLQTQLQLQGIAPDVSAVHFPLLTAKLNAKEVAALKSAFPRPGFVAEIDSLDARARELTAQLTGKAGAAPSQMWRLLHSAPADLVLWTAFTTKSAALLARFKSFQQEWPQFRSKIPYGLLQEMRIVPDLPGYDALLETIFFELMDGRLTTVEEMRAFLEPHSPPAPPPPVHARKVRASKKEAKGAKGRGRKAARDESDELDEPADADTETEIESENDELEDEDSPDLKAVAELAAMADLDELSGAEDEADEPTDDDPGDGEDSGDDAKDDFKTADAEDGGEPARGGSTTRKAAPRRAPAASKPAKLAPRGSDLGRAAAPAGRIPAKAAAVPPAKAASVALPAKSAKPIVPTPPAVSPAKKVAAKLVPAKKTTPR